MATTESPLKPRVLRGIPDPQTFLAAAYATGGALSSISLNLRPSEFVSNFLTPVGDTLEVVANLQLCRMPSADASFMQMLPENSRRSRIATGASGRIRHEH